MRFLFRFVAMFPPAEQSGRFTLGLRFLVKKLLLCQLYSLKQVLNKENVFNFDNLDEFFSSKEKCLKYEQIITNYSKKYENI